MDGWMDGCMDEWMDGWMDRVEGKSGGVGAKQDAIFQDDSLNRIIGVLLSERLGVLFSASS